MKIMVTGARGMLGTDLIPVLEKDHDVTPLGRRELDITVRESVKNALSSVNPDIVINCAAYTKVDQAEDELAEAFKVNGLAVQNLALVCGELGIQLCHISTDYVFDGEGKRPYTPFDGTAPVNVYGKSKLAGEMYIQWLMREFYIVRTSWLYGLNGDNFVKTMLRLSREKEQLRVVSDQRGSPTWTVTLAEGINRVIESGVFGVHHVTDRTDGGISWFDFAVEIVRVSGAPVNVIPISSDGYPVRAVRPRYSVLETLFTEVATGFSPPDWRDSLMKFLQTLRNHSEVLTS